MLEPHAENESVEFEVKPQAPRVRGKVVALAALGLGVVIVAGLAVAALLGTATPAGDPTARVMPSNVAFYFSMTTHPDKQPNFDVIAAAWKDSKEAKQVEDALSSALTFADFDWEKDILPWLGDRAALGVVDLGGYEPATDPNDTSGGRYRAPFVVLAVHVRDREKADAFVADFRKQRENSLGSDSDLVDDLYRNIPIVYVKNNYESSYSPPYGEAYATIDDVLVVVSSGPDDLKKVIDAALDGANLTASDNFKATMSALPDPNVAAFYMDYARYMEAVTAMSQGMLSSIGDSAFAEQQRKQMEQMREMMQVIGGIGLAMSYEPGGIRFDMAGQYFPDRAPESLRALYNPNLPSPSNHIFDSIPDSAVAAMNSTMPTASWKALLDSSEWLNLMSGAYAYGGQVDVSAKIAEFEQSAGVDLGADLFDLLNGELALVMLERPVQPELETPSDRFSYSFYPRVPFRLAAMFDSTDAARASDSLNKLLTALLSTSGSGASLQPLDSLPGSALIDGTGGIMLAYGVIDGRLVIGSDPDTLRAIDAGDQAPLSANEAFRSAMAALPGNRLSSGYVRLEPIWNWFSESSTGDSARQECGMCNYLQPLKWLSMASEPPDASGIQRATMRIALEPAN